jgi:hypothetical protein
MLLFILKECLLNRNNNELNNQSNWNGLAFFEQLKNTSKSIDGHLRSSGEACHRVAGVPGSLLKTISYIIHIYYYYMHTLIPIYYGDVYSWLLGTPG